MAKITARAGDFGTGRIDLDGGFFSFLAPGRWTKTHVPVASLVSVEELSQSSYKKISSTLIGGIAGGILFGPLGALAGLLVSGNNTDVHFIAIFDDGRTLVGTTDSVTYMRMSCISIANMDDATLEESFKDDDAIEIRYPSIAPEEYIKAVSLVRAEGKASISLVQKRLGCSFSDAAYMIEMMEMEGIISPPNASGVRSVNQVSQD